MKQRRVVIQVLASLLVTVVFITPTFAGQFCTEQPPPPAALHKGLTLAFKTRAALEESGAQVAVLGRIGADLSAYRLRYSHAGFAWRDHPQGRWLVVHELNQCATAQSRLFDEGLGNFFLDSPLAYEALLVIPSPTVQQKLVAVLASGVPDQLHEPDYSMIAYPWETRYQNSNQWLLETLAAALASDGEISTRTHAQHWLKRHAFTPTRIHLPPLTRLGARLLSANVQFDDHPLSDRLAGTYQVVTVEAVVDYLLQLDPQARQQVVGLEQ
ncbi:MAG: DUF2145 domain-containing protein [Deltaproteobacteria bacterium]|nr:DUF2145 domain-containing protein [Deltaproteobacteria bacterium]